MKIEASVVIKRRPEDVFEAVARPDVYLRRWSRGVLSVSQAASGSDWGTSFRIVGRDIGKKVEWTYEVTNFEPFSSLEGRAKGGSMTFVETYRLASSPGGTTIHHIQDLKPTGASRLLSPLLRLVWPHLMADNLGRLKAVLEKAPLPEVSPRAELRAEQLSG